MELSVILNVIQLVKLVPSPLILIFVLLAMKDISFHPGYAKNVISLARHVIYQVQLVNLVLQTILWITLKINVILIVILLVKPVFILLIPILVQVVSMVTF